jgi:predicted ATPase
LLDGLVAQLEVLDNCKHRLQGCVELADTLLQPCPGVRLLATTLAWEARRASSVEQALEVLTNRQIAERLEVTERTVAAHIEHILDRLGFASRHQVAPWATENGLST